MESHTVLSRYVYKKQLMLCIGVLALFVFGLWMAGNEALTNEMPMHLRINGIPFELSTQRATEFYWFITIFCAGLSFLLIALLIKNIFSPTELGICTDGILLKRYGLKNKMIYIPYNEITGAKILQIHKQEFLEISYPSGKVRIGHKAVGSEGFAAVKDALEKRLT